MKCAGLDPAGLAKRSVPPSDLSLLGLVRHLAGVERSWFRRILAGENVLEEYARHCGHADLIRERVDGRVGQ